MLIVSYMQAMQWLCIPDLMWATSTQRVQEAVVAVLNVHGAAREGCKGQAAEQPPVHQLLEVNGTRPSMFFFPDA